MSVSSASADSCHGARGSRAAAAVSFVPKRQLGHADDGVHRRADLVAHVGEELALRAVASSARCFAISSSLTSWASRSAFSSCSRFASAIWRA